MRIAAIADIHIRLFKRHEEYREVFDRLYTSLREQRIDRIALLGDIFHSKSILSPEAVELASEFFQKLSEIAPVDIIVGNHDVNVKNNTRMDAISPIVELIQSPNCKVSVHSKSGITKLSNTHHKFQQQPIYGIFSCLDEKNFPISFNKSPENTYIALFHGNLSGSLSENMYKFENTGYESDVLFKNYDMVMLGDIHKRQKMKCNQVVEEVVDEQQLELLKKQFPDLIVLEEIE